MSARILPDGTTPRGRGSAVEAQRWGWGRGPKVRLQSAGPAQSCSSRVRRASSARSGAYSGA